MNHLKPNVGESQTARAALERHLLGGAAAHMPWCARPAKGGASKASNSKTPDHRTSPASATIMGTLVVHQTSQPHQTQMVLAVHQTSKVGFCL